MQESIRQHPAPGDLPANEPILELGSAAERGDQAQMAAVSTAITLVLVAAIAFSVWQSRGGRGDRASAVVDGAGAGAAAVSSEQMPPADGAGTGSPATVDGAGRPAARIFLVDSDDTAAAARARIVDDLNFRSANGMPERGAHVIVVEPDRDADLWLRTMAEQDAILAGQGQPTLEIIDLRGTATRQSLEPDNRTGAAN